MSVRNNQGTGRRDRKMSRWDDDTKRARFGTGSLAHERVQRKANKKRRQRDRSAAADSRFDDLADRDSPGEEAR